MNKYTYTLAASLLFSLYSHAALNIDRTRIVFNSKDKVISLDVFNNSDAPYLGQSWIEDENEQKITSPLAALPLLQRIESNQRKTVKISTMGDTSELAKDRDTLFYYNLLEIPPKTTEYQNSIKFALHSKMKIFYRPEGIKYTGSEIWQRDMTIARNGNTLTFNNLSPYYIVIVFIGRTASDAYSSDEYLLNLKPFSQASFNSPKPIGNILSMGFVNDYGGYITFDYTCSATTCTINPAK